MSDEMQGEYVRPLVQTGLGRPADAMPLAGGSAWFTHCEILHRARPARICSAGELPGDVIAPLVAPRAPLGALSLDAPRIMGILNATPDSFSDGGDHVAARDAIARGLEMCAEGAEILDVGGESTRPGADFVEEGEEIARTVPVISGLRARSDALISIDTRKAAVARAAQAEGALLFNDVSALSFDPESLALAAELDMPVCLMHASGDPKTMQSKLAYTDVRLDVFDYLRARRDAACAAGIPMARILLDPGIGFGKTTTQNVELLQSLSMFHGLGCPLLVGASRKRFIGELTGAEVAKARMPGSVAVALEAARQGAQILRVHDVAQTRQALTVWQALHAEERRLP